MGKTCGTLDSRSQSELPRPNQTHRRDDSVEGSSYIFGEAEHKAGMQTEDTSSHCHQSCERRLHLRGNRQRTGCTHGLIQQKAAFNRGMLRLT